MNRRTFRALIDDQAFDIGVDDEHLMLNETRLTYTFEAFGDGYFSLLLDGRSIPVVVTPMDDGRLRVTIKGRSRIVRVQDEHDLLLERFGFAKAGAAAEREVHAPMPGLVVDVLVTEGQTVAKGDGLLVLEAMKMENELRAAASGIVNAVHVATGDAVEKDTLLIEIDPDAA